MRTVRVSDAVWDEIANRGKFGETVDDVLRRVFGIEGGGSHEDGHGTTTPSRPKRVRLATRQMRAKVIDGELCVSFDGVELRSWPLPDRSDKAGIRKVRDDAVEFAKTEGATAGQIGAVKKALTEAGYHLTK